MVRYVRRAAVARRSECFFRYVGAGRLGASYHWSCSTLRRSTEAGAQALAHQSGIALGIARELIHRKLIGQEQLVCKHFQNTTAAKAIVNARNGLVKAKSSDEIRLYESQAALAYWTAWREMPITFPRNDLPKVPDHWRTFGSRLSPLTRSPRLAVNPPNAMLNYLYALLESEARLALATLGLDPGIGILHNDTRTRDSLACDLMEPIQPGRRISGGLANSSAIT